MADYNYLYGKLYQFRLRYIFDDFEKTVWSPISKVPLPVSTLSSDYRYDFNPGTIGNTIAIIFNTQDPEIKSIDIAVREGNDGEWSLIDTIEKYDQNWDVLIESNIEYNYLWQNDKVLFGLDQNDTNRPCDYVPQIAECTELINENQLVDMNYIEGYDNIKLNVDLNYTLSDNNNIYGYSDNTVTVQNSEGGWIELRFYEIPIGAVVTIKMYKTYNTTTEEYTGEVHVVRHTRTEDESDAEVVEILTNLLIAEDVNCTHISDLYIRFYGYIGYDFSTRITGTVSVIVQSTPSFNYDKTHKFGIIYYDRALRPSAVNKSEESSIYVPTISSIFGGYIIGEEQSFQSVQITAQINHIPPKWAKYWQWAYMKDYANFIQWTAKPPIIVDENEQYMIVNINSAIEDVNTGFPSSAIKEWVFEEGDRLRIIGVFDRGKLNLTILPGDYDFKIVSYDADTKEFKVEYDPDLPLKAGDIDGPVLMEIHRRPFLLPVDEIGGQYFEVGELNPILNPYTENRSHGLLNPTDKYVEQQVSNEVQISPAFTPIDCSDVYIRRRIREIPTLYSVAYTMPIIDLSLSDFYVSNVHNEGRVNVVDPNARRVELPTGLRWGGNYVTQSRINNLSSFAFDDFDTVTEKYGAGTRLKQIGDVLQVRQQYRSTSIYVGRVELRQSAIDEQGFIAQSTNLLGTRYVSKEKWGCINPESEVQNGQISYYFDIHNGAIIADGYNKPVPISDLGLKDYIKELSTDLLSNYQNIKVIGGFDSKNDFLYYNIHAEPKLTGANKNVTLIFKDGWRCFVDLEDANGNPPEHFASIGQDFISFLNGSLYQHNTGSLNTFFGKFQPVSVKLVFNQVPESNKIFRRLRLNADTADWQCPEYGDLVIKKSPTFPMGMQTKIPQISLRDEEGFLFADIPSNAGFPPTMKDWVNGEPMRGQALTITLKNSAEGESNLHSASVIEQPT